MNEAAIPSPVQAEPMVPLVNTKLQIENVAKAIDSAWFSLLKILNVRSYFLISASSLSSIHSTIVCRYLESKSSIYGPIGASQGWVRS